MRHTVSAGHEEMVGDSNQLVNLSATVAALASRSFKEKQDMTDTAGIAGNRILSFIERVEHIDEELEAMTERKKEIFSEAKGEGLDVKGAERNPASA
jgi:hypothetical protein